MSQPELQVNAEELGEITRQVIAKVKELGLDVKLKEETEKLMNIVYDIRDWLDRVPRFVVRPTSLYHIERLENAVLEFKVQGYEIGEYIRVNSKFGDVKLIDIYREFFGKSHVLSTLLRRFVETLANIAAIVKENYDIMEKLKQIEEKLSDP